jgi:hypothetical protein
LLSYHVSECFFFSKRGNRVGKCDLGVNCSRDAIDQMADTVNGRFLSGASRRRVLNAGKSVHVFVVFHVDVRSKCIVTLKPVVSSAVLLGGGLHGLIWHLVSLDPHSEFLNAVGVCEL